jgi:DNA repair exonuclease SbcCD ATPase subunit
MATNKQLMAENKALGEQLAQTIEESAEAHADFQTILGRLEKMRKRNQELTSKLNILVHEKHNMNEELKLTRIDRDKAVRAHVKSVNDMITKMQRILDSHSIGSDGKQRG